VFWASSCPSSGATTTAVRASGLLTERGDGSAVGRGRAGCTTTVFKRQVINLKSCCILFVDSVESMMMHGLANPKSSGNFLPTFLDDLNVSKKLPLLSA
jgi:hypothetical protein